VGSGVVCASLTPAGAWLSIGTVHPVHGFVELNALPRFDEGTRGDPTATRQHRATMTDERSAFLTLRPAPRPDAWRAAASDRAVVQRWRLAENTEVAFSGTLDRPALAEITETDPPSATGSRTELQAAGRRLLVRAEALPAVALLEASTGAWSLATEGARLWAPAGELEVRIGLWPEAEAPDDPAVSRMAVAETGSADAAADPGQPWVDHLVEGALAYVRGCTALRVARDEQVILTDHRILPLSWTRDAYYQALLLLATDDADDRIRVADHLRWLWRRCERPDGRWVRSHHANGHRKDRAFQADQQLYPVLELADFFWVTGNLPDGIDWTDAVAAAWRATLAEVDPGLGLIRSAETAADDPAGAPYIAASQVALWYAAVRLAEMAEAGVLALPAGELRGVADRVREGFERHLTAEWGWAYATDGHGSRVAYHDANDLPVALAPLWGFCSPRDPAWRATMAFAFSSSNPGFVTGPLAGLGSVHTAGAWALGDVQAWLLAAVIGDARGAAAALDRLRRVAFADGMLPEAYAAGEASDTIDRVRTWFAWPGAALAALLLLARRGLIPR
jgi:hypothetical protein